MKRFILATYLTLAGPPFGSAQQRVQASETRLHTNNDRSDHNPIQLPSATTAGSDYVLGADDQFSLTVTDIDDQYTDKTFRIDSGGDVTVPLAGRIHAAGLTTLGLEQEINKKLSKILKTPESAVNITLYASQPVSIFGEVNSPGVHQVFGDKTLLQALSSAGGFTDNLGSTLTLTRDLKWGSIPFPNAHNDSTNQFSVASLSIKKLVGAADPVENIPIMPNDVITVSRSEVVYAVGSVNKPGGFQLGQEETLSTLQVISLAEGLDKTAAANKAMILRATPGSKVRSQIPVDVKLLLAGKAKDVDLQAEDILFIPNSRSKTITYRGLETALEAVTGAAIYGRF